MPKYRSLLALLFAGLTFVMVGAGAALAQVPPPDPTAPAGTASGGNGATVTVSHAGSPIWVFVVVAALTMVFTAAVTYVVTGRRQLSQQPA